uniref:Uncharacterized protein n=1 Tax=Oryza punctata TaxID=4537 RepID=A0A0E0LWM0_ORYPU
MAPPISKRGVWGTRYPVIQGEAFGSCSMEWAKSPKAHSGLHVWVCVLGTTCHTTEGDVPRRAILLSHHFVADCGLTPPSRPPMPSSGDIVPVQDGYFITNWGLTPPSRSTTPLSGDIVPVWDGYFVTH